MKAKKVKTWTADDMRRRMYGNGGDRMMLYANNYVMVRRPGCILFVLTLSEWLALPLIELQRRMKAGRKG